MYGLRIALFWCAFLAVIPAQAQVPSPPIVPTLSPPAAVPSVPVPDTSQARLDVAPRERQYFALGVVLAQGRFAYAPLDSKAGDIEHSKAVRAKVAALGRLAPEAARARASAGEAFARAAALMQNLDAPPAIASPVARLAARLAKPLAFTADARAIRSLNPAAAAVLSALSESNLIAKVMDDQTLAGWLNGSEGHRAGPVWYAEGQMAGIAQIANLAGLPSLLPPAADVATDLRGLRDWLALRVPEQPGPELAALQADISDFLQQTAQGPGRPRLLPQQRVSDAQLALLGQISAGLQAQISPPDTQ